MSALRGLLNDARGGGRLALVCAGVLGLAVHYCPDAALRSEARERLRRPARARAPAAPGRRRRRSDRDAWLEPFPWRYVVAPVGLVRAALRRAASQGKRQARSRKTRTEGAAQETREAERAAQEGARRSRPRDRAQGHAREAAELCFASGLLDEAAELLHQGRRARARRRDPPRPESLRRVGGAVREGGSARVGRRDLRAAGEVGPRRRGLRARRAT